MQTTATNDSGHVAGGKSQADTSTKWIACELVRYDDTDPERPAPDMFCRNLETNEVFRCDPWVGCALPEEVRPEPKSLINFRGGPTYDRTIPPAYLPYEARVIYDAPKAKMVFDDWPEYHESAMGCGLEDRNITDRYDAMRYGWDEAIERLGERIGNFCAELPKAGA